RRGVAVRCFRKDLDAWTPRRGHRGVCPIRFPAGFLLQGRRRERRDAMPTHTYEARLTWQAGGEGVAAGNHFVGFEGRPAVEVSAAPHARGPPTRLNPEELFVAALASCQLLTYLALARGAGVSVRSYEDRAVGTLAIADRKMRMTEVLLRPRITVAAGSDEETA